MNSATPVADAIAALHGALTDSARPIEQAEVADRLGARRTVLEGHGHWWMLTDPAGGAEMLRHFWAESY